MLIDIGFTVATTFLYSDMLTTGPVFNSLMLTLSVSF